MRRIATYACACGLEVPEANRSLHELRCAGAPVIRLPGTFQESSRPTVTDNSWTCEQCTYVNADDVNICLICSWRRNGDPRFVDTLIPPPIEQIPRSASSSEIMGSRADQGGDPWRCPDCTLENEGSSIFCEVCERSRPPSSLSSTGGFRGNRALSGTATGLILGAMGGAALNHFAGRSITSGATSGAAVGALGGTVLEILQPRETVFRRNIP